MQFAKWRHRALPEPLGLRGQRPPGSACFLHPPLPLCLGARSCGWAGMLGRSMGHPCWSRAPVAPQQDPASALQPRVPLPLPPSLPCRSKPGTNRARWKINRCVGGWRSALHTISTKHDVVVKHWGCQTQHGETERRTAGRRRQLSCFGWDPWPRRPRALVGKSRLFPASSAQQRRGSGWALSGEKQAGEEKPSPAPTLEQQQQRRRCSAGSRLSPLIARPGTCCLRSGTKGRGRGKRGLSQPRVEISLIVLRAACQGKSIAAAPCIFTEWEAGQ